MKRILHEMSLAGIIALTASLAFAQQSVEDPEADAPAATSRGDCVDLSSGPRQGSTQDLNEALAPDDAAGSERQGELAEDAASGTAPEDAGSSGWTGGTGGSDIGTSQSDVVESSPQQDHPAVAAGLDPISGETAVTGPQAPAAVVEESAASDC